jgi:hypothetical protein
MFQFCYVNMKTTGTLAHIVENLYPILTKSPDKDSLISLCDIKPKRKGIHE